MGSLAIIMSILPGRSGTGKDAIFNGTVEDIAAALNVSDGLIIVLGQPHPRPEWTYRCGANWRVIEIQAPSPFAAVAFILRCFLSGRKATLSQALFLSQGVTRRINKTLDETNCTLAVFDTIRTFDALIAPTARRVVFFDDLFSERFRERVRDPGLGTQGVLGRYAGTSPLWSRLVRPSWLGRWAMMVESYLCRDKEAYVAKHASASVLLNENEQARLAERSGAEIYSYIPRLGSHAAAQRSPGGAGYWLFVGAMDYPPNVDAMNWLIESILPAYRAAGGRLPLRVVGRHCPQQLIEKIKGCGGEYLGFVEDLASQYADASGVLMPVVSGAGVKIKSLEALSFGCRTIGTPRAYDGLGALPPGAVHAETAAAFVAAMLQAEESDAGEAGDVSVRWFEAKFGPERLNRLRSILE